MDTNDTPTFKASFHQRLMRDIPPAAPGRLAAFRHFVTRWVEDHIPKIIPLTFEEWLSATPYPESRKNELRKAEQLLCGGLPSKRQCSHIDAFGKSEFYQEWKHMRLINSRCDAFKAFAGRYIKPIEEAVFRHPAFIKHTPVPDRPKRILEMKKSGARYYASDYTAFESHFTPEFMNSCENVLFRHCLSNYPKACSLICQANSGNNRIHSRLGVAATITGRRMTGDLWTSLGNGFTNLMLTLFIISEKGGSYEGVVEGDDGLFSTDVEITSLDYERMGFTIKLEEVADPCSASFCGMVFSESGEIIREPRKFMQGFGWTSSFLYAGTPLMNELLRAKALSTAYETPQCPIVGAFARYALEVTKGSSPRFINDGFHVPPDVKKIKPYKPSSDTRQLFEILYSIPVSVQLEAERLISLGKFLELSRLIPPSNDVFSYALSYVVVT